MRYIDLREVGGGRGTGRIKKEREGKRERKGILKGGILKGWEASVNDERKKNPPNSRTKSFFVLARVYYMAVRSSFFFFKERRKKEKKASTVS